MRYTNICTIHVSRICATVYFADVALGWAEHSKDRAVGQIKALVAGATSLPVTLVHRAVAPGHKRKGSEQSSRHAPHQHCSQRLKQELRVTG